MEINEKINELKNEMEIISKQLATYDIGNISYDMVKKDCEKRIAEKAKIINEIKNAEKVINFYCNITR